MKADLWAAGCEHPPFVFVRLLRRHALEFVGIEPDALACRHVDANRPRCLVEPGIADGHEKPVRPLLGCAARPGHDEIHRAIFALVDDDALQMAGRPIVQIEDVDRLERPAPPPIEVGRLHVDEADWMCDRSPAWCRPIGQRAVEPEVLDDYCLCGHCCNLGGEDAAGACVRRVYRDREPLGPPSYLSDVRCDVVL